MKKKRTGLKFLSLVLAIMMTAAMAVVPASAAVGDNGEGFDTVFDTTAKATNSFGSLIADQFQAAADSQNAEENEEYVITDVTFEGNTANVSYVAKEACTIEVALYDENTGELLASGNAQAEAAEDITVLPVNIDSSTMPEYFVVKVFMLDDDYAPLTNYYISGFYTEAIQEVEHLHADDFDSDEVLNLDDDNETNFAVYNDGVIRIIAKDGENIPDSTYNEKGIYVFTNANDQLKALKEGDAFSYVYGNEVMLINVKKIKIDGDTVTITDNLDADMEEFFDYIKIDSQADEESAEYDGSSADDSVQFEGFGEDEDTDLKTPESSGGRLPDKVALNFINLKFKIADNKIYSLEDTDTEHSDNEKYTDGTIKTSGTLNLKVGISAEFKYNAKATLNFKELINGYLKLNIDASLTLTAEVKAKIAKHSVSLGRVSFRPIPGVYFTINPRFVFSVSASVTFTATISKHYGFQWSLKEGFKSTSTPVKAEVSVKIKGEIYIGLDLGPSLELVCEKLIQVKTKAEVGIVLTAEETVYQSDLTGFTKHLCGVCVGGDLKGKVTFGITLKILNKDAVTYEPDLGLEYKLLDYYYSPRFNEFGWTKCPHTGYHTIIQFTRDGKPLANAPVYAAKYEKAEKPEFTYANLQLKLNGIDNDMTRSGDHSDFEVIGETNENGILETYLEKTDYLISTDKNEAVGKWLPIGDESIKYMNSKAEGERKFKKAFNQYTVTINVKSNGEPIADKTVSYSYDGITYFEIGNTDADGKVTLPLETGKGYLKAEDKSKEIKVTESSVDFTIEIDKNNDSTADSTHEQDTTPIVASGNCGENGDNVKYELHENGTLYIFGEGRMKNYGWGESPFKGKDTVKTVIAENNVTSIGRSAFGNCSSLTSIEIANSVTSIGNSAFCECSSLTSIEIPNSVSSIGDYAFSGCISLTTIKLPNSLTSFGEYALGNCSSLTSIEIPSSVTSMGDYAFWECSSLTSVEIPNSVTSIGLSTFQGCSSLTSIEIPNGVTSISVSAFSWCTSLTDIELSDSVTVIWDYAFYGCSNLIDVYYSGTEEQWGKISIGSDNSELTSATIHYNSKMPKSSSSPNPSTSTAKITNYPALKTTPTATEIVVSKFADKEYTGLVKNGRYIFMLVKNTEDENLLASDNLVYIDQFTADEKGNLTVKYPETYGDNYTALIFGGKIDTETADTPDTPDSPDSPSDISTDTDSDTDTETMTPDTPDSPSDISSDTESDSDTDTSSNTATDTETDTESDTDTSTETSDIPMDSDSETDTESDSDTAEETDTESDTDSATDADTPIETSDVPTVSDNDSETDSAPVTDSDTESDTETDSDSDSDTDTDSDPLPNEPKQAGTYGDLDGDGKVTSGDALMILRQSVGMENFTPEQINLADVDGDGKITAGDALAVLRRSVGMNDDNNVGKPIAA